MNVILTYLPFNEGYAFHLAQFRYYFHQIFSIRSIHYSSSVFRDKHNMVGAIPASMLYTLIVLMDTSCVMLWLRTNNILTQEVFFYTLGNATASPLPPSQMGVCLSVQSMDTSLIIAFEMYILNIITSSGLLQIQCMIRSFMLWKILIHAGC